jgi:hypothetical protein
MHRLHHSIQIIIPVRVILASLHLQQTLIYVLQQIHAIQLVKIIMQEQILVIVKLRMF